MRNFLLILSAVLFYGGVHSALAALRVKALVYDRLGEPARRSYRLLYNLFALVSFLPVLALVGALPDQTLYRVAFPPALALLGFQGLAALALLFGVLQTGPWSFLGVRQLLAGPPAEERLVVQGLYRWVRHPLYTAGLVFIWATPVMTANLLALNVGLTAYILIGARFEERKLLAQFGPGYARYQACTPMLLPWRGPCEARELAPE